MKILLSPDPANQVPTGQPQPQSDKARIAELEFENELLKEELETFKTQQAQTAADEVSRYSPSTLQHFTFHHAHLNLRS
jgi:hypothetical protein